MKTKMMIVLTACAAAAILPLTAMAQDAGDMPDKARLDAVHGTKRPYSPYVDRDFPTRPLFGETHQHTSYSLDAGAFGARIDPRQAYMFARGAQITSSTGQPVKLARPLDFLVVADHSDGLGSFPMVYDGDPTLMTDPLVRKWNQMIHSGQGSAAVLDMIQTVSAGKVPAVFPAPGNKTYRSAWEYIVKAAEEFNQPGMFTAFIGYEWGSNTNGNNLHRNVIFRDGADKASRVEPYSCLENAARALGSDNPVDLWKWMSAYEDKTGGNVLAIAHNGNLSNGTMFPTVEAFGKKIDGAYASERAKWERLYEVTQMKGDGETHPFLSRNDEFANFERWDKGNLDASVRKTNDMLEFEYARSALKNGLVLEQTLGANPYKFGMAGGTDSHTGLSTVDNDNFFGKTSAMEPNPTRSVSGAFINNKKTGIKFLEWEVGAGGLTAAWAKENTRESLFDAMERRETYATTGPRMAVRLFGGFAFEAADAHSRQPAVVGYTKGVPMGGDLQAAPKGKVPTFLVAALKDPIGANLDRYQIVKGWVDKQGKVQEKVYDVAWSGDRKPGSDGKLPPVGNTVDVASATWTNTIGAPELIAVWKDPDFDPSLRAFYYGRVIEIPTPRWTAYDAKYFGTTPPPEVPMQQQERAYTSPIWYTP